jgi:hypothetical protein
VRGDESVFGIVFTQNGLVHEFLLTAGTDGLADWHYITDRWRESPHAEAIEDALFLNAQGREQG